MGQGWFGPGPAADEPAYGPSQPAAYVPPSQPTYVPARQPGPDAARQTATSFPPRYPPTGDAPRSSDVVRYGPGVPVSQAGAESVWRTGRRPGPPRGRAGERRLRRMLGSALTVILLAASGVLLYLRFHHAPFRVTGVVISQQTKTACGVDLTGRIGTNGAAGTVSYQWAFRPQTQPPQPLRQSAAAGQHAVYVTVAVEGQGHGSASQKVILQVLGPDPGSASASVVISC